MVEIPSETIFSRDVGAGSILISIVYFQFYFQGCSPGDFALEEQSSVVKEQELDPQLCA